MMAHDVTQELVVPRSIPITLDGHTLLAKGGRINLTLRVVD
jgi:hypothetical protein